MICKLCGKSCNRVFTGNICQACYQYIRSGGTFNKLPPEGVVALDSRGFPICHICGRSYIRLGSHVKESHDISIFEYKKKFGLCASAKTTSETYSQYMSDLVYQNDMPAKLAISGQHTRIRSGVSGLRKGKRASLQECLGKSARSSNGSCKGGVES